MNINECGCRPYGWLGLDGDRCIRVIPRHVYTAVIIYNIPHVFMSKLKGDVCVAYSAGGAIAKFYSWLSFVVNAIIPFTLLLYMNYVIIKKVQNSRKMFGILSQMSKALCINVRVTAVQIKEDKKL